MRGFGVYQREMKAVYQFPQMFTSMAKKKEERETRGGNEGFC